VVHVDVGVQLDDRAGPDRDGARSERGADAALDEPIVNNYDLVVGRD